MPTIYTRGGKVIKTPNGGLKTKPSAPADVRTPFTTEIKGDRVSIVNLTSNSIDVLGYGRAVTISPNATVEVFPPDFSSDPDLGGELGFRSRKTGSKRWGPIVQKIDLDDIQDPDEGGGVEENPGVKFTKKPGAIFSGNPATEGNTGALVPAEFTVIAAPGFTPVITTTFEREANADTAAAENSSLTALIASFTGDVRVRVKTSVQYSDAAPAVVEYSDWYNVRDTAVPKKLLAASAHVVLDRLDWFPANQTTSFRPVYTFPGLVGETVYEIQWTAANFDSTNPPWHPVIAVSGETGKYTLQANNHPVTPPAFDAAAFFESEVDRRGRIRFRWRQTSNGTWSAVSDAFPIGVKTLPAVPVTITAAQWTHAEERTTAPAGRRIVTVVSDITILSGYELRAYSGTTNNVTATDANTTLVGSPFTWTTTDQLATVGTVVYSKLFWKNTATGVYTQASADQKSLTIAGLTSTVTFPTIAAADWTVTEERTAAPEGRRNSTLVKDKSAPTGYELRYFPSSSATATPTVSGSRVITSPESFTTTGTFAKGVTVYTTLYWYHTATQVWTQASADQKSTVIQGLLPTTTSSFPKPSLAAMNECMPAGLIRYHTTASAGGYSGTYGAHSPVIVALAAFAGDTTKYDGITPKERLLAQLRFWVNSDNKTTQGNLWAAPGGYNMQYECIGNATTLIGSLMADVWSELTNLERERYYYAMLGSAFSAMNIASDNNTGTNLRGGHQTRGFNPNFSDPFIIIPYIVAAFLGEADGVKGWKRLENLANDFDRTTFANNLNRVGGMKDMYDTYRQTWPNGPDADELKAALLNYRYDNKSLEQGPTVFTTRLLRASSKTIARGLQPKLTAPYDRYGLGPNPEKKGVWEPTSFTYKSGNTVTGGRGRRVGCVVSDATPDRNGQTGRLFEMQSTDAEGQRGSIFYGISGYRPIMMMGLALMAAGAISKNHTGLKAAVDRIGIAVEDVQWCISQKWDDYAKGGALEGGTTNRWPDNAPGNDKYASWRPNSLWGMADQMLAWQK